MTLHGQPLHNDTWVVPVTERTDNHLPPFSIKLIHLWQQFEHRADVGLNQLFSVLLCESA